MQEKKQVWYCTVENDPDLECRFSAMSPWHRLADEDFIQWAAEDCAEDYHSNHDGWESSWPLTFVIFASADGPEIARVEIEREYEPRFSGTIAYMYLTAIGDK